MAFSVAPLTSVNLATRALPARAGLRRARLQRALGEKRKHRAFANPAARHAKSDVQAPLHLEEDEHAGGHGPSACLLEAVPLCKLLRARLRKQAHGGAERLLGQLFADDLAKRSSGAS